MDFTDAISGAIEPDKRKKHGVEVFNIVDRGSSVWVDTKSSGDFDAEQSLVTLIDMFTRHGVPNVMVFDNDPRFVGSWTSEGYPSALMRFLLCFEHPASRIKSTKGTKTISQKMICLIMGVFNANFVGKIGQSVPLVDFKIE